MKIAFLENHRRATLKKKVFTKHRPNARQKKYIKIEMLGYFYMCTYKTKPRIEKKVTYLQTFNC